MVSRSPPDHLIAARDRTGQMRSLLAYLQALIARLAAALMPAPVARALERARLYEGERAARREAEAIQRRQREVLASATHDLKTPLTGIIGYAQLLQRRGDYDEQAVSAIIGQARRVARLVDDLLDIVHLETGRLQLVQAPMDLVTLVRATAEQVQARSPAPRVEVEAPERPVVGWWDSDRLAQVFHNLLSNAIKYAPGGGVVQVRVEEVGREVRVSVRDDGPGVLPEQLPWLFEPFYRAPTAAASQSQGLGLGLSIARGIVEAHGGRIWAESTVGAGSTFTVMLPFWDLPIDEARMPPERVSGAADRPR